MKDINPKIIRLIVFSLWGKLEPFQQRELEGWLSQSKAHLHFYRKICDGQEAARHWYLREKIDVGAAIRRFDERTRGKRRENRWKGGLKVAAMLVLLLGTFFFYEHYRPAETRKMAQTEILPGGPKAILLLADGKEMSLDVDRTQDLQLPEGVCLSGKEKKLVYSHTSSEKLPEYNELHVPRGGEYKIVLSDGTFVHLNSETVLRYPVAFEGGKREVVLSGEAYFEVTKDSLRPFTVKCKEYEVKVLGTTFNISAYEDEETSMATLVEGHVRICHRGYDTDLRPGQMALVGRQGVSVKDVEIENAISWTRAFFSFQEESLDEIFKKIARWYDVEFIYESPEVKAYRFSGSIPRYEGIHSVFQIMQQAAPLRFVQEGRQIKIYKVFY